MLLQRVTDTYTLAKSKLISYFATKQNLLLLLKASTEQVQLIFNELWKLQNDRYISTASGINLDNCGEICGEPRSYSVDSYIGIFCFAGNPTGSGFNEGVFADLSVGNSANETRDDQTYRLAIQAKAIANNGNSTPEDIIKIAQLITVTGNITYEEVYPCGINIFINEEIEDSLVQYTANVIQKYLPVGVKLIALMKSGT